MEAPSVSKDSSHKLGPEQQHSLSSGGSAGRRGRKTSVVSWELKIRAFSLFYAHHIRFQDPHASLERGDSSLQQYVSLNLLTPQEVLRFKQQILINK